MEDLLEKVRNSKSTSFKAREDLDSMLSASNRPEEQERNVASFVLAADVLKGIIESGDVDVLGRYLAREKDVRRVYPGTLISIAENYVNGSMTHEKALQSAGVACTEYKRILRWEGLYPYTQVFTCHDR